MDTMIDKKDGYKEVAAKLYKENKKLKHEASLYENYIMLQKRKIQKLERSLLSAVTNLEWER